jgi:osmotically-inducible protein OsmY
MAHRLLSLLEVEEQDMATRWEERNRDFRDERDDSERDRDDRGVLSRAGDEVRSWFGDDEAAGRRRMDDVRDERRDRDWGRRAGGSVERGWERTREAARNATDRDRDGRRGWDEWTDADRPWRGSQRESPSYYSGSGAWHPAGTPSSRDWDYSGRERGFGDSSRYAGYDTYSTPSERRSAFESRQGWREAGYAGRGPRGYTRGDERIREDVCDRLTEEPRIDASDIEVQVASGEVTLEGSVRTREEKRFTEDVVERIVGVREVNNHLKVRRPDEVLGTARSGASTLGLTDTPPPQPAKSK